jgi:Zn finger protein HypA/HybF involved in hydrogenase expression
VHSLINVSVVYAVGDVMELKCKCGKKWEYTGSNKTNAVCPDCRKMVKIKE